MRAFRILLMCVLAVTAATPVVGADGLSAKGRVVDQEGNPVAGMKVYALMQFCKDNDVRPSLKAGTVTDSQGHFAFTGLPKATCRPEWWIYSLVAFKPGDSWGWVYGTGQLCSVANAPPDPEGGYELPVAKITVFEGKVVDKEGNPVPGAIVTPGSVTELSETCDPSG